jgi:xanthine dehydrogenase accessory factor
MKKIIHGLQRCIDEKKRAVIATIIKTEGSSYQSVGSRCLLDEDGRIDGIVSGGCVEQDLMERVTEILSNHKPETCCYDFRSENDFLWGMGVGCDGAVTLFLQPFDPVAFPEEAMELFHHYKEIYESDKMYPLATVIRSSDEKKVPVGMVKKLSLDLQEKHSGLICLNMDGVNTECYVDWVAPRQQVVIFGAGPDAVPLVKQLATIEWRTTVVDHRPYYAKASNFPGAERVQLINRSDYDTIRLNENVFAIIMTHNFTLDVKLMKRLIQNPVSYIGILGSKKRIGKILNCLSEEEIKRFPKGIVHSPIGLDIGASTPEEIAISIVAEMIAFKKKKNAAFRVVEPTISLHSQVI